MWAFKKDQPRCHSGCFSPRCFFSGKLLNSYKSESKGKIEEIEKGKRQGESKKMAWYVSNKDSREMLQSLIESNP